MPHLLFFLALVALTSLFALAEIQIEGSSGWAANLPTWKLDTWWTKLLCSGKPLTGYHLYMQLFTAVAVHLPFALGMAAFSWRLEARVMSFFILFWVLEDFLWFIFNPAYGLKRFKAEHIWWHAPSWLWIMPRDYWIFLPVGFVLYCVSY